jgi:protein-S-isoprenylcysteine O-methyltransferase Ste14
MIVQAGTFDHRGNRRPGGVLAPPGGSGSHAATRMLVVLWLRSAFFTLVLPGTVLIWVPLWLSGYTSGTLALGAARWIGVAPLIIGTTGLLWCIWDFGRSGKGTLAPVDPARFVVRTGLYRVVRNPMYLSVLTALAGEVLLFRSPRLLAWGAIAAIMFHLFVVVYEEPTLQRQFGTDYEAYCRAVSRWLPRRPTPDAK